MDIAVFTFWGKGERVSRIRRSFVASESVCRERLWRCHDAWEAADGAVVLGNLRRGVCRCSSVRCVESAVSQQSFGYSSGEGVEGRKKGESVNEHGEL